MSLQTSDTALSAVYMKDVLTECATLAGNNPFEGYVPEIPDGERMDYGSDPFIAYERQGSFQPSAA